MTDPESDQPKTGSYKPAPYGRDISFIEEKHIHAVDYLWECPCCGDSCIERIESPQNTRLEKTRIAEDARCCDCRLTKSRTTRNSAADS